MKRKCGTLVAFLIGVMLAIVPSSESYAFEIISFRGQFTRWSSNTLSYVLDSRGSDNFENGCDNAGACVSSDEAIRAAFNTWTQIDGVDVSFVEQPSKVFNEVAYDNENVLVWVESGWTSLPFQPPSNALAVTISTYKTSNMEIVDTDIHFNGDHFEWAVVDTEEEQTSGVVDIQNIATHEIGHFLGLGHSSEDYYETDTRLYLATMFFASGPGETFRRNLEQDDFDAMNNLYPRYDYDEPNVDSVSPNSVDINQVSVVALQIVGEKFLPHTTVVLARDGDTEDVTGRMISVAENEIQVSFDLYGVPSGTYDVVVFNAYDRVRRLEEGLTLTGGYYNSIGDNQNSNNSISSGGGGCNLTVSRTGAHSVWSGLLVLVLPLLLIAWVRFHLSGNRPVRELRSRMGRSARN